MAGKHYRIKCTHIEEDKHKPEDKRCKNHSNCAIHCHNNEGEKCRAHCGGTWETETEHQANSIKHMHIAENLLHRPIVEEI